MSETKLQVLNIDCPNSLTQVKDWIEDLADLCPSDANLKLSVNRLGAKFSGLLVVASLSTQMQAQAASANLEDLLWQLSHSLLKQIEIWRQQRFVS